MNLLLDPSSKRSNSKFQCTISVQVWITTCGIKGNKAFFLSSHTHYNWQWEKDYEKDEKVAQGDLAAPSFCLSFSVGITASRVSTAPSHHLSYLSPSRLLSQWRRRCFGDTGMAQVLQLNGAASPLLCQHAAYGAAIQHRSPGTTEFHWKVGLHLSILNVGFSFPFFIILHKHMFLM